MRFDDSSTDVCVGAGGLGTGMMFSGYVETKWAVEFSPSAAQDVQV